MTTPEPTYPPLSTREIQALPDGARVIVTWADGLTDPTNTACTGAAASRTRRPTRTIALGTWTLRSG